MNPYLKIKYMFEIFHQPAVKLKHFQFLETKILKKMECRYAYFLHVYVVKNM